MKCVDGVSVAAFIEALRMQTIQAAKSETQLADILDRVERGETLVIARDKRVVARISPEPAEGRVSIDRERIELAFARIDEIRKRTKPVSIEEILSARDEGRR